MGTRLVNLAIDAADPGGLARFWSAALGWSIREDDDGDAWVEPPADDPAQRGQVPLLFLPVPEDTLSEVRSQAWQVQAPL